MSSEPAIQAPAPRVAADLSGRSNTGLAGLIDVLDRADGSAVGVRQGRRTAVHRAAGTRSGGAHGVPLRSVQPAPMARPTARSLPATGAAGRGPGAAASAPMSNTGGGLRAVVRRAALWGAGPGGEYLAWSSAPPAVDRRPRSISGPVVGPIAALVRRMALWGAGPDGQYLAWQPRPAVATARDVDPPVVLREMPSTPTITPAAISTTTPAAASRAAAKTPRSASVPVVPRVIPPVPPAPEEASPGLTSPVSTGTSHPPGWPRPYAWPPSRPGTRLGRSPNPSRAVPTPRSSGRATPLGPSSGRATPLGPSSGRATTPGPARARGDPSTCPVRGSPPPRWAPFAPG